MLKYETHLRPLLFRFAPETIHHATIDALHLAGPVLQALKRSATGNGGPGFLARALAPCFGRDMERQVFGLRFPNPVGLAAGMDKNAVALPGWESLGFGFAEVGTITARPQPGNPKPRVFRIPSHKAIINRMGFNNGGADVVAAHLQMLRKTSKWPKMPVGINLGKSKVTPLDQATEDYLFSFSRLKDLGDYFVLNVSSPNTPGLRALQDKSALDELIGAVQSKNLAKKPLLVKIAPDLDWSAIDDVLVLAEQHRLAGIIATNTTIDHSSVPESARTQGGLSGAPLRERSTEIVRYITRRTQLPVVAAGGIMDADAALEKFDAGAVLVQIYTGLIYRGPGLIADICNRLRAQASTANEGAVSKET